MNAEPVGQNGRRLRTWKEIAAFFGCDERTVKRWEESRGLPVHRLPNGSRSGVFAYEGELRAWLHTAPAEERPVNLAVSSAGVEGHPVGLAYRKPARALAGIVAIALLIVLASLFSSGGGSRWAPGSAIPAAVKDSANPEARKFYQAGLYGWQSRTPAGLTRAVDDFTQAIVRDPQYAKAYAGLADCYNLLRAYTAMPDSYAFPRAKAAAERAIALDPSLADAHAALGFVDFYWTHNMPQGARELREAIRLAPRNATAHHWYAVLLMSLGRFPEALTEIEKARQLDTASAPILAAKGLMLFLSGRTADATELLQQLEEAQPRFAAPHLYLSAIAMDGGDDADFVRESLAYSASAQHPADRAVAEAAKRGLDSGGHTGMLLAMLGAEQRLYSRGQGTAYGIAESYAQLGNDDEALRYLRASLQRRESDVVALNIEPQFRGLRKLPAFRELEREAGVAPGS